jgi:hypothetical protein
METDPTTESLLGGAWLAASLKIEPIQALGFRSFVGTMPGPTATSSAPGGPTQQRFTNHYRPQTSLPPQELWQAHITIMLKREEIHLEFLWRLFEHTGGDFIGHWAAREPNSAYCRRAGFLFEFLTGKQVPNHQQAGGNYVDAIDSARYLTATQGQLNRRWRVVDNMPGDRMFCPMIELTPKVRTFLAPDYGQQIEQLVQDFGEARIMRSVNWLTVKESRASFHIENEGKQEDRIHRFARAISQMCGVVDDPLSSNSLKRLQRAIVNDRAIDFQPGLRRSPVFVGHSDLYAPIVDYIAPHHDMAPSMVEGLRVFELRTRGQSPALRAAAISFGFAYIHPLADGNGRISRFLINDVLRRDNAIPAPLVLPVSSIISASARERDRYDRILETVSRPLMKAVADDYHFERLRSNVITYADGVKSNFVFDRWSHLEPTWRYLNLTQHCGYMGDIISRSMTEGIRNEARYLMRFDSARAALKEIVDATDEAYDHIVRAIIENRSAGNKIKKMYPHAFSDPESVKRIESAVLAPFALEQDHPTHTRQRTAPRP